MNKTNKKGFTLAELLIVVAIIAVLVAIAIPVFTAQLEKSREAVDAANIRAKYAELMADGITGTVGKNEDGSAKTYEVTLEQERDEWQTADLKNGLDKIMILSGEPKKGKKATLTYDSTKTGKEIITCTFAS